MTYHLKTREIRSQNVVAVTEPGEIHTHSRELAGAK
jgi:hypothetical protein